MNQVLPHNTQTAATQEIIQDCKNLGLLLDKFAPWEEREGEWNLWMETTARRPWVSGSAAKGVWLRDSQGNAVSPTLRPSSHFDANFMKQVIARWTEMVRTQGAALLNMEVDYRLVVGFGAEHALETNLCLHRIYGFPIISGSAVKGVTRAWAMLGENLPEDNDLFIRIFGTTERQGQVIFFDAYPTEVPKLQLDILNPHYSRYYQGREPPADYLTPVPTYFLTVAKPSSFQFAVASRDSALANKAQEWLKNALMELGIGGKTAGGYGFMKA
jgi:CRISPR-associated protein Cmr6